MATTPSLAGPPAVVDHQDEVVLYRLIAELALEDVSEITDSAKGKSKEGTALTDAELALQLFADEAKMLQSLIDDHILAQSMDSAIRTDHALVQNMSALEEQARRDHAIATALSEGLPMPPAVPPTPATFSIAGPSNVMPKTSPPATDIPKKADGSKAPAVEPPITITFPADPLKRLPRKECTACGDKISGPSIDAPCNHSYCSGCIADLVQVATRDQSLYPVRCCRQSIPYERIRVHLSAKLAALFEAKEREYNTPGRKVYCSSHSCGAFICALTKTPTAVACPQCPAATCGACNAAAHSIFQPCATDAEAQQVLELGRTEGWQRCPQCHQLVELSQGCFHMTCRCRAQFCYVCAAPWKTCTCLQWDEDRLLAAAQRQVEVDVGGARNAPPRAEFDNLVRNAVGRLRVNHEHQHGRWRYRPGGGRCEECWHNLPSYLFSCGNGCGMAVCNRCRRNRL